MSKIALPTSDESDELLRIRHSCAHIMAMAMQRVHRGAQVTIGPWIENGFYYDFDMSGAEPFTEKVLKKVKKELRRIIRKDLPFIKEEVTPDEARARIEELGEPYKLEILDSILARCSPPHLNLAGPSKPHAGAPLEFDTVLPLALNTVAPQRPGRCMWSGDQCELCAASCSSHSHSSGWADVSCIRINLISGIRMRQSPYTI